MRRGLCQNLTGTTPLLEWRQHNTAKLPRPPFSLPSVLAANFPSAPRKAPWGMDLGRQDQGDLQTGIGGGFSGGDLFCADQIREGYQWANFFHMVKRRDEDIRRIRSARKDFFWTAAVMSSLFGPASDGGGGGEGDDRLTELVRILAFVFFFSCRFPPLGGCFFQTDGIGEDHTHTHTHTTSS